LFICLCIHFNARDIFLRDSKLKKKKV